MNSTLVLRTLEDFKGLKYKYWRCLDQKRWGELADCFTENATRRGERGGR